MNTVPSEADTEQATVDEVDLLMEGLDPKAKIPARFEWWGRNMQLAWLRSHQVQADQKNSKKEPKKANFSVPE